MLPDDSGEVSEGLEWPWYSAVRGRVHGMGARK